MNTAPLIATITRAIELMDTSGWTAIPGSLNPDKPISLFGAIWRALPASAEQERVSQFRALRTVLQILMPPEAGIRALEARRNSNVLDDWAEHGKTYEQIREYLLHVVKELEKQA